MYSKIACFAQSPLVLSELFKNDSNLLSIEHQAYLNPILSYCGFKLQKSNLSNLRNKITITYESQGFLAGYFMMNGDSTDEQGMLIFLIKKNPYSLFRFQNLQDEFPIEINQNSFNICSSYSYQNNQLYLNFLYINSDNRGAFYLYEEDQVLVSFNKLATLYPTKYPLIEFKSSYSIPLETFNTNLEKLILQKQNFWEDKSSLWRKRSTSYDFFRDRFCGIFIGK